jgi:threonyl-tRNA synthetase
MEHTAGKWPFWLSPKQAVICSVSSNSNEYAKEVHQQLWREGFEVDLDISDKKLPKKIRNAQVLSILLNIKTRCINLFQF